MEPSYRNIGKIYPEGYEIHPCLAKNEGLFVTHNLILKLYSTVVRLHLPGELGRVKKFLRGEVKKKRLEAPSGLGFVVISEVGFNVSSWADEFLHRQGYISDAEYKTISPSCPVFEDKELRISTYTLWELGIIAHERNAWWTYLQSSRRKRDKCRYLNDFLEGSLVPN